MLVPYEPSQILRTSGTGLLLVPESSTKQGPESGLNMDQRFYFTLHVVVRYNTPKINMQVVAASESHAQALHGERPTEDRVCAKCRGFVLKEPWSSPPSVDCNEAGPRRHGAADVCGTGCTDPLHSGGQQTSPGWSTEEANQDLMRNSSLQARTESFFIHQARQMPYVNASYGPLSVQQPVPLEMLQTRPGPFNSPSFTSSEPAPESEALFTFNWKVHTYIINERVHPSMPKVQVLFYVAGRNWDDYSTVNRLPCVRMFAFHETQEVRGTCRLKGELGMCVAELEPLASWFSPPTVRPGRQRVSEQAQGTPVELYYMVQMSESGECSSEDSRRSSASDTDQPRPMGYYAGHTPMQRIGSVRLLQPLSELKLDNNFVVMSPSKPIRQRETVSTFLALSTLSSVQIFTLRELFESSVKPQPRLCALYEHGSHLQTC
ncbi:hypothetical protein WMY93_025095 [Mugilogobius chulae]|uniref:Transmembrane protein TMEM132 N-terminal domain-containing protein n=1 Tax=Mugilogobius chulae TaxID=88201 RepID=A0AAW0NBZ7_9GOBI